MARRSWGPFSGLQLTAIIITALVVIGVPGTVFAVDTFSNVAVEDPVSGVKASVDNQHRLKTLDTISGAITGTTAETTPDKLFRRFFALGDNASCQPVFTVPANKALVLKSGTFYVVSDGTQSLAFVELATDSGCSDVVGGGETAQTTATIPMTFGSGTAFKAGSTIYGATQGGAASVDLYGYYVAANAVPATTAQSDGSATGLRGR